MCKFHIIIVKYGFLKKPVISLYPKGIMGYVKAVEDLATVNLVRIMDFVLNIIVIMPVIVRQQPLKAELVSKT